MSDPAEIQVYRNAQRWVFLRRYAHSEFEGRPLWEWVNNVTVRLRHGGYDGAIDYAMNVTNNSMPVKTRDAVITSA